ncbi:MAG: response regulator [Geminicoccaceae bacterium]
MVHCIVVDDSATVRHVVRRMLDSIGMKVEEAEDGQQALDACRRSMPDLILLDWNMPVMDGLTFLKHLRRLPSGQNPKVIFCTTVTDLPHIEQALDAGADEYIMKPFDEAIIRAKLHQTGFLDA